MISQGGFAENGRLFGTFSDSDSSPNQTIQKSDLTDFSLTWSGNSIIPTFTTTLAELLSEKTSFFCFGNTCSFGQVGTVVDSTVPGYTGLPASPGILLSTAPVEFQQISTQSSVPEPSTIAGVAIAALLFLRRRFQNA